MYMFLLSGILITVCGNLVVIISISHFKQLHTPTNLLVLSMAVADFLLGLFVMPFSMVRTVETCWYFGDTFYRYYAVCDPLLYTSKITMHVIFTVARRHSREISTMEDQMQSIEGKKRLAPRSKDRKATKTLSIVIGVFILCWLPYFVNSVMDPYVHSSTPPIVVDALQWLGYFNSGCNPIIYGFFYPWFQKALNLILTCEIFNPESSLISVYSGSH
ncbi:trace amine-associated receptor 3-like [Amia ocellicauda]|uniref:trace amine-associated receptor 3-like n=1 Tax=Amia ocellicauda TaxID=2972642 RepID=UPI00346402F7